MSGICGAALADANRRAEPADIAAMAGVLESLATSSPVSAIDGPFGGAACATPGTDAGAARTATPSGPLVLLWHGTLYNAEEFPHGDRVGADPAAAFLALYRHEGLPFLARLRGEFALAIWDGPNGALHLATDHFRIHPLFYSQGDGRLWFASRMRALLAGSHPPSTTIRPEAIVDVTALSIIPSPKTIYREVSKLPPGSLLTYRNGEVRIEPWWDMSFVPDPHPSEPRLARELKETFADAVHVRLRQEPAPDRIGAFLSGGIDSSTVTAVLTQLRGCPIKTFSIGFGEQHFNEIGYARIAARAFGAEHHEYFVSPDDVLATIPVLLDSFDEPFANASAVPSHMCAKFAHEHGVDTLYAGDGGDELFAGNERYAVQRIFDYYGEVPRPLREGLVTPLVFGLAATTQLGLFVKARKYIERASIPYPKRLYSYGLLRTIPLERLFTADLVSAVGADYDPSAGSREHYYRARGVSELDRQLYIDLKVTISDNDLFKVTRMAHAAGVATRFPFLDHRVAEFAGRVPSKMRMRDRELRSFFKRAYADLLPAETRAKKKQGFGLPIPVWLRTDRRLNELMQDLVLSQRSLGRGYFRRDAVEDLVCKHRDDTTSFYGTILWNLMVLELWHRAYHDRPGGSGPTFRP